MWKDKTKTEKRNIAVAFVLGAIGVFGTPVLYLYGADIKFCLFGLSIIGWIVPCVLWDDHEKSLYISVKDRVLTIILIICVLLSIITGGFIIWEKLDEWDAKKASELEMQKQKELNKVENALDEGGKLYIDGQEVDIDTIVLEDYKITFKNGNVILSDK